jgi:hypothetical protein
MDGNGTLYSGYLEHRTVLSLSVTENAIMEHPLPALSGLISPHDR